MYHNHKQIIEPHLATGYMQSLNVQDVFQPWSDWGDGNHYICITQSSTS